MVPGPAGIRCPDCASLRGTHLYRINPLLLLLEAVIGLIAGVIGASLVDLIGLFFFFIFFAAAAYGGAVGEAMLRAIGRKHGKAVELVGAGSFVGGGLLSMVPGAIHSGMPILQLFMSDWRQLLGIGLAAAACYGRLRY
jgi:hypothetical protein